MHALLSLGCGCAACFAYDALAGKPLLTVTFDLEDYNGKLASLHMAPMGGAPVSLRNTLQAMLAQSPSLRPPAISFAAAGYFQVRESPGGQVNRCILCQQEAVCITPSLLH